MKENLKDFLIIGNDWLCHIIVGAFLVWKFGWWGVPLAFLSHFPIDAIPHGHHKKEWLDALKGLVAGVSIVISVWSFYGFTEAFKYGIGIFFSINFDFLLAFLAKPWDEKKFWENKTKILSRTIFIFTKIIIWINFITHWFTRGEKFERIWKKEEKFNSLPNQIFHALKPSWYNLLHLIPVGLCILLFLQGS